jgi:hypothetical protein
MRGVAVVFGLAACGRMGFDRGSGQVTMALDVEPLYPGFVAWSDYVRAADPTIACDGTELGGPDACLHAGEARSVAVDAASCDGLALRDELGVLQWRCVDTPVVHFVGGGLQHDRGLRDLLDGDGWRLERVVLSKAGTDIGASELEVWWPDPVLPLPAGGQLATPAVYTLAASAPTSGFTITGSGIAVVTLGDAELSPTGAAAPNCEWGGLRCLFTSQNTSFLWLEVRATGAPASGTPADRAIDLSAVTFSTIRATTVGHVADTAVRFGARASRIYDLTVIDATQALLWITQGHSAIQHVRLYDSSSSSIAIDASATDITYVDVLAAGSPVTCIAGVAGPATMSHVMAAGCNEGFVIYSAASHDVTLAHAVSAASGIAFDVIYGSTAVFAQTVATDASIPIRITSASARFTDSLLVGNGCETDSPSVGLDNLCKDGGASDAKVTTGASLASSFVGGLPAKGRGNGAGWDWHLRPDDLVLRGKDGTFAQACAGMRWLDDGRGNVFAVDAIEIPGDNLGDDDGLCERGEACIYSPNLGFDQGSGDYTQVRCDGDGVILFAYPDTE